MRGKIGDEQRLLHITEAIAEIENYTRNVDLSEFKGNSMIKFASIKQIEIIGEAAKNISDQTKEKFPSIEWKLQGFEIFWCMNILEWMLI